MRDRLSLFPLETPLKLSNIVLDIRDQEARTLITNFDLQMSKAWFGSETFQHLPQGLSIPIGNTEGKLITVHDDRGRFVEAYERGRRVYLENEEREKYSQSHQQMVDRLSSEVDAVDPPVVAIGVRDRLARVASPVVDAKNQIAYWISGWPSLDELSSIDAAAVGITAKFATFSLAHGGRFSRLGNIDLSAYAQTFAKGRMTSTQLGDLRDGVGVDLEKPYIVFAVDNEHKNPKSSNIEGGGIFSGNLDDVSLYATNLRENADPKRVIEALAAVAQNSSAGGVSSIREGLVGSQKSTYEALVALGYGKLFDKNQAVNFEDIGVFKTVAFLSPRLLDYIVDTEIGPILEYDSRENVSGTKMGDLLATLTAFLDGGRSVAKTAESLFLHRNSLNYRLNRIHAIITGTNLSAKNLNSSGGMIYSDIPRLEGLQLGVQCHRIKDQLAQARALCDIDNPEDLL